MNPQVGSLSAKGSEWNRWDPHLHAPGTLLNDQFKGDWDAYLNRIEGASPQVRALGVTDYLSIGTYKEVLNWKKQGRLKNVDFIFPNVEFRLDIKTEKRRPINIHLLFSPDDKNHIEEIERVLGALRFEYKERAYQCTRADLIGLGRTFDAKQTDELGALRVGATQFKTTLPDLQKLFRGDEWIRKNCLVAISGGLGDGTAGLQEDDSFAATRREIERFAHIVFSSTPGQREFWLGKKPGIDKTSIEKTYGFLRPCLHGSDAHKDDEVLAPFQDRFCWIKGDLTFESLRQVVIEPEERVWIGIDAPVAGIESLSLREIAIDGAPWLRTSPLELNAGLVAVIGARGSGKTALADFIASGSGAIKAELDDSSFIKRAKKYLREARVTLSFKDGARSQRYVTPQSEADPSTETEPQVCYLSQHFVEQLCSSSGLATELRREIERVVFQSTDPTQRMQADSFGELVERLADPIRRRRSDLVGSIGSMGEAIVKEDLLRDQGPKLERDREALIKQIEKDQKELTALVPKGKEVRAKRLAELEKACIDAESGVEILRRKRRSLDDLAQEVAHIRSVVEPGRLTEFKRRYAVLGLSESQWTPFTLAFSGDVDGIIDAEVKKLEAAITVAVDGDAKTPVDKNKTPLSSWPLKTLRAERDEVKKDVGIDIQKQKKYEELQKAIVQREATKRRLDADIKNAEKAIDRRKEFVQSRRDNYVRIFKTIVEEQGVLEELYRPLREVLKASTGALEKLQFVVNRQVDLDGWVANGEKLLDLRKSSQFQGHGALRKLAAERLLPVWVSGAPDEVGAAMDSFRETYHRELSRAMPSDVSEERKREWGQAIAAWLYDTAYVRVQYGIEYEGVAVEQLSPGTRGIVLLLLYLAVDQRDLRPLIVDQPEENLDPQSVFLELVPHFREARKRRQIVVVTHNANLVVNTDADQVIVATSERTGDAGLPTIGYRTGSLENQEIRMAVCEILEGGERAFLERERRYRFRWGEDLER